jgi:hypothetical protein
MAQFLLLSAGNSTMAIQAGASSGTPPTLQVADATNPLQIWEAEMQTNSSSGVWTGIAFFNPSSGLSVTYNGDFQPLVMQDYSVGSTDQDAWVITSDNSTNATFQIAYPPNNGYNWNDLGGQFSAGDNIGLWNGANPNSFWQVSFVTPPSEKK